MTQQLSAESARRPPSLLPVLAAMYVGMTIIAVFVTRSGRAELRDIAASPATTMGVVVELRDDNHEMVDYRYRVEGDYLRGISRLTGHSPRFRELRVGDSLAITYSRRRPELSFVGSLSARQKQERSALVDAFVTPAILVAVLFVVQRRLAAKAAATTT